MDKVTRKKHKKVMIDGKEYGYTGLLSLRNRLIQGLKQLDPLEELMTYCDIPTAKDYEMEGVKLHVLELKEASERRLKLVR